MGKAKVKTKLFGAAEEVLEREGSVDVESDKEQKLNIEPRPAEAPSSAGGAAFCSGPNGAFSI